MPDAMKEKISKKSFDREKIHAGNIGRNVDHTAVQIEVERLLASMSLQQKIHEIRGWQAAPIDGLFYAGGDEVLNIPSYRMVDGPRGARTGMATAFPVAIARGATFDVELERKVGLAAGLDKDAQAVIRAIGPMVHFWHLTQVDEPRALASEQLMTRLSVVDQVRAETTGSVKQALENAVRLSGGIDTIVVFGSFPVVGEALEYLDHHPGARLQ